MIIYKIIITVKADQVEETAYDYISENFGGIYAKLFREKLLDVLEILSRYPFIGRVAKNDKSLRVFIFSKQNKMVYKVMETNIIIVRILNTKTNLSSNY